MNYYERLCVARDADKPTIKRAYFAKVKQHTPDHDPEGFKVVREAYEALMNDKERSEYDSFLQSTQSTDLLTAKELMKKNSFKEAVDLLSVKLEEQPGNVGIMCMLAECLWRIRKTGKAEELCKKVLDDNPTDVDTWILRGRIAHSRGHTTKALEHFKSATAYALSGKDKSAAWEAYLSYIQSEMPYLYRSLSKQAISEYPDVFQENYIRYLLHVYESLDIEEEGPELIVTLDRFVKYFLADKDPVKECYNSVVNCLSYICNSDDLMPAIIKLYPALEASRFRDTEHEHDLSKAYAYIAYYRLRTDKRIHPLLCDLTTSILDSDFDISRNEVEAVIVTHLPQIRKSVKILRSDYAEYYGLNSSFYMNLLDSSKTEYLHDRYTAVIRKIASIHGDEFFDADDDNTPIEPFTRESPKIGRNAPCPCGSGKKHKHCCG